ncbi:MAG: recombinase family protein [Planctomycetota bacterium]
MMSKIQESHTSKIAHVYLRQSTMGQVRHNQESTERQYALRNKAEKLGWPPHLIKVLDGDLGLSGAQMSNREDFKTVVADVSMGKVGAVFALEASRLSRSCTDWHRLLELCSLTGTLIIDEDGCYNPADFNDQLLLGLKGTMSAAELHFMRARLQGGKLNKAKKGKLRRPLPVGLCFDDESNIVIDPDIEVQGAIKQLFAAFKEAGTAYGVVQQFAKLNQSFPKRAYGGIWNGRLLWGRLTHSRVTNVLKNPAYAGSYVHGRYKYAKRLSPDGKIRMRAEKIPMPSWQVHLQDHHEKYVAWDEFLHNQQLLQQNRTNAPGTVLSSPAREGLALLQGLLVCGVCGRGVYTRYTGNGGIYPTYQCNWRKREGLSSNYCLAVRCDLMDKAVADRMLEVVQPAQLELAIKAFDELEQRQRARESQWRMKIERSSYEAQLAQRRYEEVDPANRLVAGTLEKRWNDALSSLEQVKNEYAKYQEAETLKATAHQRSEIMALAKDLPRLWRSPTTQPKDRKRILRLLIKDITIERIMERKEAVLHVRWQGGTCEDILIKLPPNAADRVRYPAAVVERVRALAATLPDLDVAATLTAEGLQSATGKTFTVDMIEWIRFKHRIPRAQLKRPEELTVAEVAHCLGVSDMTVYDWVERGFLSARRLTGGAALWITLKSDEATVLAAKIARMKAGSPRPYLKTQTLFAKGAV